MIEVRKLCSDEWALLSRDAHLSVFKETRPAGMDRVDFAYLAVEGDKAISFVTVKEMDSNPFYLQHGGTMPEFRGTGKTVKSYKATMEECFKAGAKQVSQLVENTNTPMLLLALKTGCLIVGSRYIDGSVFVELRLTEDTFRR